MIVANTFFGLLQALVNTGMNSQIFLKVYKVNIDGNKFLKASASISMSCQALANIHILRVYETYTDFCKFLQAPLLEKLIEEDFCFSNGY